MGDEGQHIPMGHWDVHFHPGGKETASVNIFHFVLIIPEYGDGKD